MLPRLSTILSIASFLLVAPLVTAQAPAMTAPGPASVIRQWVQPEVYRGACPATLRFIAEIEKGGWGVVRYRWMRSDGYRTPVETIDFLDWRPKRVSLTWQVDGRSGEPAWASVEILEPPNTEVRAGKAVAKVICDDRSSLDADVCGSMDAIGPLGSLARSCLLQKYDRAGVELADTLNDLGDTMQVTNQEAGATVREAEANRLLFLLESQKHWLSYRDSACQEIYYEFWPGSMAQGARLTCLLELTESRIEYLKRRMRN